MAKEDLRGTSVSKAELTRVSQMLPTQQRRVAKAMKAGKVDRVGQQPSPSRPSYFVQRLSTPLTTGSIEQAFRVQAVCYLCPRHPLTAPWLASENLHAGQDGLFVRMAM
jgi:hypothetical protein